MYIDASSYFTSQELCMYFYKQAITVVLAVSTSHKSVDIIEKSNNISEQVFKNIREPGKE